MFKSQYNKNKYKYKLEDTDYVVTLWIHVYLFCTNMLLYDSQRLPILEEARYFTLRA